MRVDGGAIGQTDPKVYSGQQKLGLFDPLDIRMRVLEPSNIFEGVVVVMRPVTCSDEEWRWEHGQNGID